jgi:hypothetical protein
VIFVGDAEFLLRLEGDATRSEFDSQCFLIDRFEKATRSDELFQIFQTAIPTVKDHTLWRKVTSMRLTLKRLKVIVLAQAIIGFVVDAVITLQ